MKTTRFFTAILALTILSGCNFVKFEGNPFGNLGLELDSFAAESTVTASGTIVTREFNVADFDGITSNAPCKIIYTMGPTSVKVDAPDNIMDNLIIYTEDRTLNIKFDKVRVRNLRGLDIYVSSRTLQRITMNGAVDFSATSGIGAETFDAQVNGAADIDIKGLVAEKVRLGVNGAADADISGLKCDSVTVKINGAGDCSLSGTAGYGDFTVNGAGSIDIKHLQVDRIDSAIHGAGSISRK